jgi:hypothetical protein
MSHQDPTGASPLNAITLATPEIWQRHIQTITSGKEGSHKVSGKKDIVRCGTHYVHTTIDWVFCYLQLLQSAGSYSSLWAPLSIQVPTRQLPSHLHQTSRSTWLLMSHVDSLAPVPVCLALKSSYSPCFSTSRHGPEFTLLHLYHFTPWA